ncbi:MAG: hypothetical protein DMG35_05525 [Acidobacteria bacterium]|nr:MAG: hypothetical protein DMG35_05525 [Acidobacteriota bacterium]
MKEKDVHITQLTDDELEAQREELEKKPRPLTLDRLDLEDIKKEQERRRDLDPRKMGGCGKPKPGFLYQKEPKLFLALTTRDTEHCGDAFPSPQSEPPAILLCEECAVRYGLKW